MESNDDKCKCNCHAVTKECKEMSTQTDFAPEYSYQVHHYPQGHKVHKGYYHINNYDYESFYENAKEIANIKKQITLHKTKLLGITYFKYGNLIYFYKPFQRLFKPIYNEPFDMEEFITKHAPPFSKGRMCIFLPLFIIALVFLSLLMYVTFHYSFNKYIRIAEVITFSLLILLLLCTFTFNPGAVFINDSIANLNKDNVRDYKICLHCKLITLRQRNVCHCDDCGACFEDKDHHCDVFGKCIAKRNKYLFYGTLGVTISTIACIYILVILFLIRLFTK